MPTASATGSVPHVLTAGADGASGARATWFAVVRAVGEALGEADGGATAPRVGRRRERLREDEDPAARERADRVRPMVVERGRERELGQG